MASVAIVAAIGIGFAAGFISTDFLSSGAPAAQGDLAAAVSSDGVKADAAPDVRLNPSPEADLAATEAATKKNKQTKYGQWTVICPDAPDTEPEKCVARLALIDNKRKVAVVNWLIGYNKDKKLLMEITTPGDVLIASGLRLSLEDGKLQRIPYFSCGPAGCLTRLSPDAALLKRLRKIENVKLGIDGTNGKTIVFTIKMDGIADGLNALAGL